MLSLQLYQSLILATSAMPHMSPCHNIVRAGHTCRVGAESVLIGTARCFSW